MITNEREGQHGSKKRADLEVLIEVTHRGDVSDDGFRDLPIDRLESQATDRREELVEFPKLHGGSTTVMEVAPLAGLAEQQVQRYESTSYRTDSLAYRCDMAEALDVTIPQRARLGADAHVA